MSELFSFGAWVRQRHRALDYGLPLSHIARLRTAGHGGQILLSQTTQELVREQLSPELTLRH